MPVQAEVRRFLQNALGRDVRQVSDVDSLLEAGAIDSLGVIHLVSFIEERFKVEVSEDDMIPDNFDSIAAIAAFVERGRSERAG